MRPVSKPCTSLGISDHGLTLWNTQDSFKFIPVSRSIFAVLSLFHFFPISILCVRAPYSPRRTSALAHTTSPLAPHRSFLSLPLMSQLASPSLVFATSPATLSFHAPHGTDCQRKRRQRSSSHVRVGLVISHPSSHFHSRSRDNVLIKKIQSCVYSRLLHSTPVALLPMLCGTLLRCRAS
jgi:hypothetical protein